MARTIPFGSIKNTALTAFVLLSPGLLKRIFLIYKQRLLFFKYKII